MTTRIKLVDSFPPPAGRGDGLLQNVASVVTYNVQVKYVKSGGVLQIPLADGAADDEAESLIIKTHAPSWQKWVIWEAKCVGSMPALPDFEARDANEVLIDADFTLGNPIPADGQNWMHSACGFYRFALEKAPSKSKGFRTAYSVYFEGGAAVYKDIHFKKDVLTWP